MDRQPMLVLFAGTADDAEGELVHEGPLGCVLSNTRAVGPIPAS
jgi:hypothetical protein